MLRASKPADSTHLPREITLRTNARMGIVSLVIVGRNASCFCRLYATDVLNPKPYTLNTVVFKQARMIKSLECLGYAMQAQTPFVYLEFQKPLSAESGHAGFEVWGYDRALGFLSQRVLSTHMGYTHPNNKGSYYYRNHTLSI